MSVANPRLTAADINRDLNANQSLDISVKQCLRNANLFGRRPSKKAIHIDEEQKRTSRICSKVQKLD